MDVRPSLVEFPADDPERARRFWSSLLGVPLAERTHEDGSGWQTHGSGPRSVCISADADGGTLSRFPTSRPTTLTPRSSG